LAIVALCGYLISAEREARRLFLEKQLENCVRLAEVAEKLPAYPVAYADLTEWKSIWVRLYIFSDGTLDRVQKTFIETGKKNMHNNALCVARMCRVMVHSSWSVIPNLVQEDPKKEDICSGMVL
jgi:hypothetical protein